MAGKDKAKKGKQGTPAAPSIGGKTISERSKGSGARGSKPFPDGGLTDIQKVLLVNGGIGHRLRSKKMVIPRAPKRRASEAA